MAAYADRPVLIASVVVAIAVLNAADLVLTVRALERGALEVNPIMAAMLSGSPAVAAFFKLGIGGGVAAGLWSLRRYRQALAASLGVLAGMSVLFLYHLAGVAFLGG